MARRKNKKEDIELAEEHIKIANDLICETAKEEENERKKKLLTEACLSLEKAEAEIEEEEKIDD